MLEPLPRKRCRGGFFPHPWRGPLPAEKSQVKARSPNRRFKVSVILVILLSFLLPAIKAYAEEPPRIAWVSQFGTIVQDQVTAISVDSGGVYVAGYTGGGVLPGQTGAGSVDAFVRKYDASGNEIWTRQFGTSSYDYAWAISVDSSGIYVAGQTFGAFPGETWAGWYDVFVRKYDVNGNEVWTRQFGSSAQDYPYAISTDSSGVYVAGTTQDVLPDQTSAGFYDAFVRKNDVNGNEAWTQGLVKVG